MIDAATEACGQWLLQQLIQCRQLLMQLLRQCSHWLKQLQRRITNFDAATNPMQSMVDTAAKAL
jgi:ABC-type uncharacterized transport system fused permease/ATPase subunit